MLDPETYKLALRDFLESSGKSVDEIAEHLGRKFGVSPSNYGDIEYYAWEIAEVFTLEEFRELASYAGKRPQDLLPLLGMSDKQCEQITYHDLVDRLLGRIDQVGRITLEDEVGWELEAILESRDRMLKDYNVSFYIDLARVVGLDWQSMLVLL